MREYIAELYDQWIKGLITQQELYNKLVEACGDQIECLIVVNTENNDDKKLEVIVDEDNVLLSESITEEQASIFISLGAEVV